MSNKEKNREHVSGIAYGTEHEFVTVRLADQLIGIPVLVVHDVLKPQKITKVPLSPDWVAGVLNLRGRIVTAIDLRTRLGLPPKDEVKGMSVVVEHDGEPYSLQVDSIGDVIRANPEDYEKNPVTLNAIWRDVAAGVYRLDGELMVVIDTGRLLTNGQSATTASAA